MFTFTKEDLLGEEEEEEEEEEENGNSESEDEPNNKLVFWGEVELQTQEAAADFFHTVAPNPKVHFRLWNSGKVCLWLSDDHFDLCDEEQSLAYFALVAEPTWQELQLIQESKRRRMV